MKTRKLYLLVISAILALLPLLSSCGATHTHTGVWRMTMNMPPPAIIMLPRNTRSIIKNTNITNRLNTKSTKSTITIMMTDKPIQEA